MESASTVRLTYERSGRVAWLRFLPAALGTVVVAAGMGWCRSLARDRGLDFWAITASVLAVPVALAGYIAVARGRCRNRWVAGALGLLATMVFLAADFHADMVRQLGPAALTRLDLLPDFIARRVAIGAVFALPQFVPPDQVFLWGAAVVQLLFIGMIIGGVTYHRSLRAYCEHCGEWMRSILLHSEPGKATKITRALESGDLASIPVTTGRLGAPGQPFSSLEFEYCPRLREAGAECVAYLTLKEFTSLKEFSGVFLDRGQLSREELDALAERVAALAWLRVSAPSAADDGQLFGPSTARHSATAVTVERLTPDAGTRDFDRVRNKAMAISIGCLLMPLIGLGMLGWSLHPPPWHRPLSAAWLDWLVLVAGSATTLAAGFLCWVNLDYPGILYARRWMRGVIAERPDALVAADDPECHLVSVVPRSQWGELHPTKPADWGLLRVDHQRRQLLFEGMKERYVIPADAVVTCAVESIIAQSAGLNLFAAVLTVHCPRGDPGSLIGGYRDGCWEIPLVCRPNDFRRYNTAYRRELAKSLCTEVESLMAMR